MRPGVEVDRANLAGCLVLELHERERHGAVDRLAGALLELLALDEAVLPAAASTARVLAGGS